MLPLRLPAPLTVPTPGRLVGMVHGSGWPIASCLVLVLCAPTLAGASREVGLLVAPDLASDGGDVNLTELHEWPGADHGSPAIDQAYGAIDASVVWDHEWNLIASLGFYELAFAPAQPVSDEATRARLGYDELELFPRHLGSAGTMLGCDLDLQYADGPGSVSWQRCDGSMVLYAHPHAQAASSWMIELIGSTQRELHLPVVFPGIAYCQVGPHLQWSLGFPFSYLDWQPRPDWSITGQVADNSQLIIVYGLGLLRPGLVYSWDTTPLRVPQPGQRGAALAYEEMALGAQLTLVAGPYGSLVAGAGRAMRRILHERDRTLALGSAWQSTASGELDF